MEIRCKYDELVDVEKLVPNPKNPNKHSEKQIDMLVKIFKYHGIRHPIIVSKRSSFLVVGHGRLEAAKKMGLKEYPVEYQEFESEASEYAFMVADNKIPELANLDDASILESLNDLQFDLENMDFEVLGLEKLNLFPEDSEATESLDSEPKEGKYKLVVELESEKESLELQEELLERGYLVRSN